MILSVEVRLGGELALTVETELSARMARAFATQDASVLATAIDDLVRQIGRAQASEEWRLEMRQRLQFALGCSMLSALTGAVVA